MDSETIFRNRIETTTDYSDTYPREIYEYTLQLLIAYNDAKSV